MADVKRTSSGGGGSGVIGREKVGPGNPPGSRSGREDSARSTVAEQIAQAVQSTSNLLHLMQLSSPSHAQLMKLPKNLLSKAPTIKNTAQVLEQLPRIISSLDAHMESGLESVPHLRTVTQLLVNMESSQLSSLSRAQLHQEAGELSGRPAEMPDRLTVNPLPSRGQASSMNEQ